MAQHIKHEKLRPGRDVYDAALVTRTNDGWRRVSTTPQKHENTGKLIVWFVDGGAAVENPDRLWLTR